MILGKEEVKKRLKKNKEMKERKKLVKQPKNEVKNVPVVEEPVVTECDFSEIELKGEVAEVLKTMEKVFGHEFRRIDAFNTSFPIKKCFLEVYLPGDYSPTIFSISKFNIVTFKEVFIQKLLHKTCTLFIFAIRKAKIVPNTGLVQTERESSIFYNHKTYIKEVTPIYVNDQWKNLFRRQFNVNRSRYVKVPNILQGITELNKHNPYDLHDDELNVDLRETIEIEDEDLRNIPEKLWDFTYSRSYVTLSRLRPSHMIREGAVPIEKKIDDREIFRRRDLIKLYTRIQWKNKGRDIKKDVQPAKRMEIKGWKDLEYYSEEQTCVLKIELDEDGKIPQNEYGNIEVMNGVPPTTRYINLPGIKFVLKKIDIDWVPAVSEFEFRNGRFVPILKGAVIHDKDYKNVMEKYNLRKEELEKREHLKEEKLMDLLWKDLFKTLYTKKYFKDKRDGAP